MAASNKNKYSTLQKDLYRESGQWHSRIEIVKKCIHPNLRFIMVFRMCQSHPNKKSLRGLFWHLLLRRYQIKYGFQIYPKTRIGAGLYLGHFGQRVINPDTVIGENCNIAQGVTIGQANRGKLKGTPRIGNKVWIGANAVLVGNIHIGDNVLVAPNAYVNSDVPANSIVVGNPATIIPKENATEGYINHCIPEGDLKKNN